MREFFLKKEVFFICFLGGIFSIFLLNIFNIEVMKDISEKAKEEFVEKDYLTSGNMQYSIENILKEEALDSINLKEVYGLFHKLLGKKEVGGFYYIKGKDEMMYYGTLVRARDETLPYAKRVKRAMEEAEKKGAKTLFVMLPSKNIYGISDTKGEYMINDKNGMQDDMLVSMQYCQVPTLDLRKAMVESNYPIEKLFYKTDNTWTTEAAFIASSAIVKEIREEYGDDWDSREYYTNLDNYEKIVYENATIGTFGRNTGVIYSGRDDFSILYPKFDTMIEWYNLEEDGKKSGSFKEALLSLDLEINEGVYANPGNDLYLSGIVDRDRIVNMNNPDGPKILCFRDGNFSAVASFLAPMCSQVDLVYTRSEETNLDYEKLIIEEEYDYLLIVGNPYNIDEINFNYFKE